LGETETPKETQTELESLKVYENDAKHYYTFEIFVSDKKDE